MGRQERFCLTNTNRGPTAWGCSSFSLDHAAYPMPPGLCTYCSPCQKHLSLLSFLGYIFFLKGTCFGNPSLTLLDNSQCSCYKLWGIQLLPLEDAYQSLWR